MPRWRAARGSAVEAEARRIEAEIQPLSRRQRRRQDQRSGGKEIAVDAETAHLLDFAAQCFAVSDGLFDITSGVLRRIWRFDGSDCVPTPAQIKSLRGLIGWRRVSWKPPAIVLPAGMEIDLGGLAKEYAVDRALAALGAITALPALVNFGGDLACHGPAPQRQGAGMWPSNQSSGTAKWPACWNWRTARSPPAATRGAFF